MRIVSEEELQKESEKVDEEDREGNRESPMSISLNSMVGIDNPRTMKLSSTSHRAKHNPLFFHSLNALSDNLLVFYV